MTRVWVCIQGRQILFLCENHLSGGTSKTRRLLYDPKTRPYMSGANWCLNGTVRHRGGKVHCIMGIN